MTAGRRRGRRWLLVVAVAAAALLGIGAALNGTLVYAQSPGQALAAAHPAERARLSGTVVPGTLHASGDGISFELDGGGARVPVASRDLPTAAFREGEGAVVEGHLGADGVFTADRVITKHSNTYRAKDAQ